MGLSQWFSWGGLRRALHPIFLRLWSRRSRRAVMTRVEGFDLLVLPSVFHPKYFGSSAIFGRFIAGLPLQNKTLLDVGCGSGIIALCAARSGARVTAVDINPAAVESASRNSERAGFKIASRVSDLFSNVPERFDIIAWNPPFLAGVPQNPAAAAFFGGERYDIIGRFAKQVGSHLNAGGRIYTVVSTDVDIEFIRRLFDSNGLSSTVVASEPWIMKERMVILCSECLPTPASH